MKNAGSYYLIVLGLMLCAAGGVFTWLMWRSFERASGQRDWEEVPCVILESRIAERRIGPEVPRDFGWQVLFGYEFGGERHTSGLHSVRGRAWSHARAKAEALVERFPAGSAQVCFVNPADPGVAVLKRDSKGPGYSLWFPLLIVVGGLGMIAGAGRAIVAAARLPRPAAANSSEDVGGEAFEPGAD
ncbi:MAG: DUF3592 domain-containing protein [Akkermansiaceae bacterium]|nr:DUF3592 domain-containing protein [Akkermansiaceae bacterium]